ncbi:MAG: glycosyltransferase 87 family protein [Bacteroidota bacterium]
MILKGQHKAYKILFVILLVVLYYIVCISNPNKDFDVFIAASNLLAEGKTCYNVWLHSGSSGLKYFYSPLFAIFLFPLRHMPQLGYNSVWFICNLFFVWRIYRLLFYFLPLNNLSSKQLGIFLMLSFLSVARFLFDNLQLGQMTIFMVYGALESLCFIQKKQVIKGAALLALIINIKIIPIAVLVLLIYKAEYRAVLFTLFFVFLSLILPIPIIGFGFNQLLLSDWWMSLSASHANSILDDYGRQSLSSFIPALLMDTPIQFGLKRNFIQLEANSVNFVLTVVRLLFLMLMAILLGKPFQKMKNDIDAFYSVALICLYTPLIFPHQGKYSFIYLLPAYAYVLFRLLQKDELVFKQKKKISLVLLIVSFVLLSLSTDGLIGRRLSDLCEYLNFITIGTFILLAALVLVKQKQLRFRE